MTEREHFELFLYRVWIMRMLQEKYFRGDKSLLKDAKKAEERVDKALKMLTQELGYNMIDIDKKYKQSKLF